MTEPKFKVGDRVRVARAEPDAACGWMESMDEFVGDGKAYEISRIVGTDCYVDTDEPDDGWWFPQTALEPAEYGNEEN